MEGHSVLRPARCSRPPPQSPVTTLLAGRIVVRLYGDALPGPDFEAAEPDLEDVYFSALAGHVGRRRRDRPGLSRLGRREVPGKLPLRGR